MGYSPWSHRSYVIKVDDPNLDVFLLFADSPAEMLRKYTLLTGRTVPPPTWSYGMWMSRAIYKTADEVLEVAKQLRERRIPCDVLTLDGRAWHKAETRFDFSWDADRYADPAGFVQTLREMDYRLCLWEYSYLSTLNPMFGELAAKKYFLQTRTARRTSTAGCLRLMTGRSLTFSLLDWSILPTLKPTPGTVICTGRPVRNGRLRDENRLRRGPAGRCSRA